MNGKAAQFCQHVLRTIWNQKCTNQVSGISILISFFFRLAKFVPYDIQMAVNGNWFSRANS